MLYYNYTEEPQNSVGDYLGSLHYTLIVTLFVTLIEPFKRNPKEPIEAPYIKSKKESFRYRSFRHFGEEGNLGEESIKV